MLFTNCVVCIEYRDRVFVSKATVNIFSSRRTVLMSKADWSHCRKKDLKSSLKLVVVVKARRNCNSR